MIEVDVDHALEESGEKALEAITQLVLRQRQFEKLNSDCAEGLVNLQVCVAMAVGSGIRTRTVVGFISVAQ